MSKARKILKRTLVGTSLVSTVALILWWNSTSADGLPIFWIGALVLLATVFEVSRMGALARMQLLPALLATALAAILLASPMNMEAMIAGRGCVPQIAVTQPWLYAFAGLAALAGYASMRVLMRLTRTAWLASLVTLAVVLVPAFLSLDRPDRQPHALIALGAVALALCPFVAREQGGATRLAIAAGLGVWVVPPLLLVWSVWAQWGTRGLVALLALSKFGDTCGYYVGSTIGKTHPFPKISPGKTTAGCVGSFVGVTTLSGILWSFHVVPDGRYGLVGALIAGATINIAAQAGDLLKSWTKRRAGVKDSSNIFGPAGGLLDQVDSLLLTVPMACATWPWLFAR